MYPQIKRLFLYLLKWQGLTPTSVIIAIWLAGENEWIIAIIINLIGGCIFFFIDKVIFKPSPSDSPLWEIVMEKRVPLYCHSCQKQTPVLFRIVEWKKFNWCAQKKDTYYYCTACANRRLKVLEEFLNREQR